MSQLSQIVAEYCSQVFIIDQSCPNLCSQQQPSQLKPIAKSRPVMNYCAIHEVQFPEIVAYFT